MSERMLASRRMRWTTALSLALHAAALLLIGRIGEGPSEAPGTPTLQVQIAGLPEEQPSPEPAEPLASDVEREEALLDPSGESAQSQPAPRAPAAAAGPVPPAAPGPVSPAAAAIAVIASANDDGRGALPAEPAPAAAPPSMALGEPEREQLLRRVSDWIHELQAADPRRARLSWQQDGRPYTAVLTRRPAAGATGLEHYDVEISTVHAGGRWQTGLSLKRLAFSHYTQFVDRWDPGVQLHDDEISGRFHANSSIVIGYDREAAPRFLGKVTTAGRGFRVADGFGRLRREEIFRGGLETGVERIGLPGELRPPAAADGAAAVHRFAQDVRIRFLPDGRFEWHPLRGRGDRRMERLPAGSAFLLAAPGAELHVSGTLRGQVLVYSPERIVIEGSLRYARDPRTAPDSEDLLGLVSGGRVVIAGPRVTGRGDLEIHAAIYARTRFAVTDVDARRAGTLRIYGSLTAGSLTATEPRYATQIEFDPRFEERRPPGFPVLPRFELAAARDAWTPEP